MLPRTAVPTRAVGRYTGDSVATASPARLLVMLYERLVLDLARAEQGLREGRLDTSAVAIAHAQDIVSELLSSLDQDAWDGGPALASVYTFVFTELSSALVRRDPERVLSCRGLVEPLRDAWIEAAASVAAATAGTTPALTGARG